MNKLNKRLHKINNWINKRINKISNYEITEHKYKNIYKYIKINNVK